MDEEKKFDTPEIILLLIIAVFNDFLEVIGDLSLALPFVGEIAEAFLEVGNLFIWGGITLWFIMKLGLGGPALLQIAGGAIEMIGVPSRTLTVLMGIFLANHPKLAEVAAAATIVEGGVALEGSVETAEEAVTAGKEVTISEATEEATIGAEEVGAGAAAGIEAVSEEAALGGKAAATSEAPFEKGSAAKENISSEELGEEKSPFEKLQELTEKIPSEEKEQKPDENEDVEIDDDTNTIDLSKAA